MATGAENHRSIEGVRSSEGHRFNTDLLINQGDLCGGSGFLDSGIS
jgi:hypothetical protein